MAEDRYRQILKQYWGYDDFRGIQLDIIESVCAGRDTLGLMPTGGGKSICFQVPALAMEGVCIVVTPLISLMKDQVANLKRRGITFTLGNTNGDATDALTIQRMTPAGWEDFYTVAHRSDLEKSELSRIFVFLRLPRLSLSSKCLTLQSFFVK